MWKIMRITTKTLAYRIHPDVPSDAIHCIARAQDMVIVIVMPETLTKSSLMLEGSTLFESHHEAAHVALLRQTLNEKVQMIGHETVSMNSKSLCSR